MILFANQFNRNILYCKSIFCSFSTIPNINLIETFCIVNWKETMIELFSEEI